MCSSTLSITCFWICTSDGNATPYVVLGWVLVAVFQLPQSIVLEKGLPAVILQLHCAFTSEDNILEVLLF